MTTHTMTTFPNLEERLKKLVEEHKALKDEPLLLAVYYAPERNPDDIFLFEVIENFGGGSLDEDQTLFEVTYGPTPGFPMAAGQLLHLVMTHPEELAAAVREEWVLAEELRTAFRKNQARVLFADKHKGQHLLSLINA